MDEPRIDIDGDLDAKVAKLVLKGGHAKKIAESIAERAKETAPEESGDYKAGIIVQDTKTGARVIATDYKSAWIEFGAPNRNEPAQFILRKAAQSLGLKFKKQNH